jgi:hypothetical protein
MRGNAKRTPQVEDRRPTDQRRLAPRTRGWRPEKAGSSFLAQLFVWRNWPIREVLQGWLHIFRDRLIVLPIRTCSSIFDRKGYCLAGQTLDGAGLCAVE